MKASPAAEKPRYLLFLTDLPYLPAFTGLTQFFFCLMRFGKVLPIQPAGQQQLTQAE